MFIERREGLHQRRQQRSMVRFGTAGAERPVHVSRVVAELVAERANQVLFDFNGERAVAPGGKLRIECRHQRIGDNAHRRCCRVEQSEIARMAIVNQVLPHLSGNKVHGFQRVHRLLEIAFSQSSANLFDFQPRRRARGFDFGQVLFYGFNDARPQPGARLIVQHQHN